MAKDNSGKESKEPATSTTEALMADAMLAQALQELEVQHTQRQAQIELREFKIAIGNLPIASHQYWVRYDSKGYITGELHGMATDTNTGAPKAMGMPGDTLKVWTYPLQGQPPFISAQSNGYSGLYKTNQDARIMLAGDEETISTRWNAAFKAAYVLDQRKLSYEIISANEDINSGNSNSIARTFGDIMGFAPQNLSGRLVTGQEKNLLPKEIYPDLYHDWPAPSEVFAVQLAADESNQPDCIIG